MLFSHVWKIEKIGSLTAFLTQNGSSVKGLQSYKLECFHLLYKYLWSFHGLQTLMNCSFVALWGRRTYNNSFLSHNVPPNVLRRIEVKQHFKYLPDHLEKCQFTKYICSALSKQELLPIQTEYIFSSMKVASPIW